jgi:hypothetical protein
VWRELDLAESWWVLGIVDGNEPEAGRAHVLQELRGFSRGPEDPIDDHGLQPEPGDWICGDLEQGGAPVSTGGQGNQRPRIPNLGTQTPERGGAEAIDAHEDCQGLLLGQLTGSLPPAGSSLQQATLGL